MTSNASLIGASIILVLLLAGYGYVTTTGFGQRETQVASVANPASEHCIQLGGTLEIRTTAAGEAGYCVFAEGRICEEWALMQSGTCVAPQQ